MEFGVAVAMRAWTDLSGLRELAALQVVVDPESPLGRRGWISILGLGATITASVPRPELRDPTIAALTGLTPLEATEPGVIVRRLPPSVATLGPAALFYPPEDFTPSVEHPDVGTRSEVKALMSEATPLDLDESGIQHIESPAFVSRSSDGAVAAVCGYRRWPNGVAHLSVLTHSAQRQRGHGRRAASAAVAHAVADNLLPQWRARPTSSQRLALSLGLALTGAQFGVEPK